MSEENIIATLQKQLERLIDARDAEKARADKAEAQVKRLESAPLCANHAETWYCERPNINSITGCVWCDLEQAKAKAEAACAEMRQALRLSIGFYSRFQFLLKRLYGILSPQACWSGEEAILIRRVEDAISLHRPKAIHHALSSDCGTGWLSPEVREKVAKVLSEATKCIEVDYFRANLLADMKQALALLDKEDAS